MSGTRKTDKGEKAAVAGKKRGTVARSGPKRLAAVSRKQNAEVGESAKQAEEKPLRPSQCRRYLRTELAGSFRGIVKGFVKQAKSGSVQHLKVATALLEERGTKRQRGKGPAELLLDQMRRASEREEPEQVEYVWRE